MFGHISSPTGVSYIKTINLKIWYVCKENQDSLVGPVLRVHAVSVDLNIIYNAEFIQCMNSSGILLKASALYREERSLP